MSLRFFDLLDGVSSSPLRSYRPHLIQFIVVFGTAQVLLRSPVAVSCIRNWSESTDLIVDAKSDSCNSVGANAVLRIEELMDFEIIDAAENAAVGAPALPECLKDIMERETCLCGQQEAFGSYSHCGLVVVESEATQIVTIITLKKFISSSKGGQKSEAIHDWLQ